MERKDLTEDRIVERGLSVIAQWNEKAVVPLGWNVDVEKLISGWLDLAASIPDGETWLLVSSNGVMRFSPIFWGIMRISVRLMILRFRQVGFVYSIVWVIIGGVRIGE